MKGILYYKMECKCIDCKYLGVLFEHLRGHLNCEEWKNCNYPLPYYAVPKAVAMTMEHSCKVYKKKEL